MEMMANNECWKTLSYFELTRLLLRMTGFHMPTHNNSI